MYSPRAGVRVPQEDPAGAFAKRRNVPGAAAGQGQQGKQKNVGWGHRAGLHALCMSQI